MWLKAFVASRKVYRRKLQMQIIVSLGKNVHELNFIRELIKSQYNIYDYHFM